MNTFQYPAQLHVFAHVIDVKVLDEPIVLEDDAGYQQLGVAYFDPTTAEIKIWHNPDKPSIGQTSFFHEMIEAVNSYSDLQLNHTQITTLASAMCQMWGDLSHGRVVEAKTSMLQ